MWHWWVVATPVPSITGEQPAQARTPSLSVASPSPRALGPACCSLCTKGTLCLFNSAKFWSLLIPTLTNRGASVWSSQAEPHVFPSPGLSSLAHRVYNSRRLVQNWTSWHGGVSKRERERECVCMHMCKSSIWPRGNKNALVVFVASLNMPGDESVDENLPGEAYLVFTRWISQFPFSLFSASTADTCRQTQNHRRKIMTNRKRSAGNPWQPKINKGSAWAGLPVTSLIITSVLSFLSHKWILCVCVCFVFLFLMLTTLP